MDNRHLDFIIGANVAAPSFDPLNSDFLINALHVEQMVGTLVRLGPSGRYEPYLAEGWNISNDHKIWSFQLKEGLTCEDGTEITASTFIQSLNKTIQMFSQEAPIPLIERLLGYKPFVQGKVKALQGLKEISSHKFEMTFDTSVQAGLLEYLGLPFLGFYCPNNFDAKGRWKDKHKIISSGAYAMSPWDGSSPVHLTKRPNWFLGGPNGAATVSIHRTTKLSLDEPLKNKLILQFSSNDFQNINGLQSIPLTPTSLFAIVLSPDQNSPFSNLKLRKAFQRKIRTFDFNHTYPQGLKTSRFYPHLSKTSDPTYSQSIADLNTSFERAIKIYGKPSQGNTPNSLLRYITESSLNELGASFIYDQSAPAEQDLMSFRNFNNWDIRPTNVDVGGGIENQLIKFMFCSKLGVSFPDPSGRICALVTEYEEKFGDDIPKQEMEKYLNQFDQIIEEDAAVIPILKSGKTWLVSPNIDTDFLSPTAAIPFFDLIKFK